MHWELIKLRRIHGVSQKKMAKLLNINPATYSDKENGKTDFKLKEIYIIAILFNKKIEEIFLPPNIEKTDIFANGGESDATTEG